MNPEGVEKEENKEECIACTITIIGDIGTGKTSIINRYVLDTFTAITNPTPGANFSTKVEEGTNKKPFKFAIWDTSGADKYRALTEMFCKRSQVIILVYDTTRRLSFEDLKNDWIPSIINSEGRDPNSSKFLYILIIYFIIFLVLVIIGNKADMYEYIEVEEQEGKDLAKEIGAFFHFLSARLSTGVKELFSQIRKEYENLLEKGIIFPIKENPDDNQDENDDEYYEENEEIENLRNKVFELEEENKNLKEEINNLNNKNSEFQNEINILKKYNSDLLNKYTNSNSIQNNKDNNINNIKEELISLMKKLEMKENEIKSLKEGNDFLPIIFTSADNSIHYSIVCKKTDKFDLIENKLYNIYPQYEEGDNSFYVNGNKIDKSKTISDNNIKYSDIVTVINFDKY